MPNKNAKGPAPTYYKRDAGPPPKPPRDNRRKKWILRIAVLVVAAIVILLLLLRACGSGTDSVVDWFDSNAQTGNLPTKTQQEIQEELNRIVEEGMFNISIASAIYIEEASGEGIANIENIAANHYHMSVTITLDDTGEVVYQSKGIRPGQFIETIRLDQTLPQGDYQATALFTAHNQEDYSEEGQAAAKIRLIVVSDIAAVQRQAPAP